jgi:AraC-like DNA-binding protein
MMATETPPLMSSWRYAPLIHWGDTNPLHLREIREYTPRHVYALTWVQDGQAWLGSGDERRKARPPLGLFQPPSGATPVTISPGSSYQRLHFDVIRVACRYVGDTRALTHVSPAPQPTPLEVWGAEPPARLPRELELSFRAMMSFCTTNWYRDDLSAMQCNARLAEWLAEFIGHLAEPTEQAHTWGETARSALEGIIDQPTRIAEVAEFLGMGRNTFTRRFKDETGMTPSDYLQQLRLEKARRLLAGTNIPVYQVARRCGSRSAKTFATQFRKHTGLSPREYRLQSRR